MRRALTAKRACVWSQSCREQDQLDEKSAFRPCGRDLVEFFNSTGWAFLVKLA
jgi:hypothetical protein